MKQTRRLKRTYSSELRTQAAEETQRRILEAARSLFGRLGIDPVKLIAMTPRVSRAIYESEASNLGLIRHASGFSPALRKMEQEFERIRYDAQEARVRLLFKARKARRGLTEPEARRILWMYTSRDVYRMLVSESGWTPDRYEAWLSTTLLEALVDPRAR